MRVSRPTLIYDGECGLCRKSVALLSRWDPMGRVTQIPFQDQGRVRAFRIPMPALAGAMHLILPDGRVLAGADAAPELLRLLPGKEWLAIFFRVPGIMPVARRMYAWIARRRHCLVRPVQVE